MENNQLNNPDFLDKKQGKDNELQPNFDDLINHVESLTKENQKEIPTPELILEKLLEQIEPIDFDKLAFSNLEKRIEELNQKLTQKNLDQKERNRINKQLEKLENIQLNNKHYLIISIENILKIAKNNNWGLCKNHDFVFLFNGAYWSEIDKETLQNFLGKASEKMGVPKFNARFFQFREQLTKQFFTTAFLQKPNYSNDIVLINLQNGTLEISTKGTNLRPFDREDFITYQLPFKLNTNATAPIFETFLNRVLDKESQKVLAEYLGYVFIRNSSNKFKLEKALLLYGTGANGKSVIYEVVTAIFGRMNISNYSLENLTEPKGFYRAFLLNKLLNYASEINGKLETSLFKALVSGEPIEACQKYGQPFTMNDYAKLIFNCNELPKDVEHTNAYFRRFLIIPFNVTIPEHEQDTSLHSKIIETELSGVFNWILDGLNRLLEQGRFSDCEAIKKAVEQYKEESNSVQMFLIDNDYKSSPNSHETIKDLYREYREYCNEDGIHAFKKGNFTKQLRALNYNVVRVSGNKLAVYLEKQF